MPTKVRVVLVKINATADNGYAQYDEVDVSGLLCTYNSTYPAFSVVADATNVTVARDSSNNNLGIHPKGGGGFTNIANANWNVKIYASL